MPIKRVELVYLDEYNWRSGFKLNDLAKVTKNAIMR